MIDQLIKILIDNLLSTSIVIIPNFFSLQKVYNTGAAWSILSNGTSILIIIAIIAFLLLLKYQNKFKINFRNTLAFGLIYGGLIGNLIDRIVYGHVIDYLRFVLFNYDFPIFNLADSAIVIGFILLILAIIKGEENENSSK